MAHHLPKAKTSLLDLVPKLPSIDDLFEEDQPKTEVSLMDLVTQLPLINDLFEEEEDDEASLMDLVTKLPLLNDLFEEEDAVALTDEDDPVLPAQPTGPLSPYMDAETDTNITVHDEYTPLDHISPRPLTDLITSLPQLNDLFEDAFHPEEPSCSPMPPSSSSQEQAARMQPSYHHEPAFLTTPSHLSYTDTDVYTELFPAPELDSRTKKAGYTIQWEEDEAYFSTSSSDEDEFMSPPRGRQTLLLADGSCGSCLLCMQVQADR
jgi:hypothetical protein